MKLWIDCDPGHDDVAAILTAARHAELVGISTVAGNAPLSATTRNALVTVQLFDIDVPVHAGCDRPLVRPAVHAGRIHGESGLAGPVMPEVTRTIEDAHGAVAMVEASRRHPGMWIVPIGPMTNVALALRLDPTMVDRIGGVSFMGGGTTFGNSTPWAEFNIWADPEAAAMVLGCGAELVMSGLNITHEVLIRLSDADEIRRMGVGPRAEFLADVVTHFAAVHRDVFFDDAEGPLHDPCAVLTLTHPHLFSLERRHVEIELQGRHTRGMTVVDQRGVKGGEPPNTTVATGVDGPGVTALLMDVLRDAVSS